MVVLLPPARMLTAPPTPSPLPDRITTLPPLAPVPVVAPAAMTTVPPDSVSAEPTLNKMAPDCPPADVPVAMVMLPVLPA